MAQRDEEEWDELDRLPSAEARRHRIGPLLRQRVLRLCDRCMHGACIESARDWTGRSWKRRRITRWRRYTPA